MSTPSITDRRPAEIVRVPFLGGSIESALVKDEPHVIVRPALTAMGLDADGQLKKLRRKSWATTVMTTVVAEDGRTRDMAAVSLDTWSMLLANIDENRVSAAAKPIVVDYQRKSAKALRDFWTKGGAVNPAASPEQLDDLQAKVDHFRRQRRLLDARAEAELLRTLEGHVSDKWLDEELQAVVASGRGLARQVPQQERTLIPETYLIDKGVSRDDAARHRGQFGKYLKAAFVLEYGSEPPSDVRRINGRDTVTAVYYERDRKLFDQVWDRWYADRLPSQPSIDFGGES